jgi:hypothetical protein
LAARLATQVIKAYEQKKNGQPIEHLKPPADEAPSHEPEEAPPAAAPAKATVVTGLWSDGDGSDHLQGARFRDDSAPRKFHRAVAAPGMEQFAQSTAPHSADSPHEEGNQRQRRPWREVPGVVAVLPEPVWRTGGAH